MKAVEKGTVLSPNLHRDSDELKHLRSWNNIRARIYRYVRKEGKSLIEHLICRARVSSS